MIATNPVSSGNNSNVLQDKDDSQDKETSSRMSGGADRILGLYAGAEKREGIENAPKTIKTIGTVEVDEGRSKELESEFKKALEEALGASDDKGLRVLDDPEGLVAKKVVALSPKAIDSYNALIKEANNQLTEMGHDASILKDDENLKRFFNLASMNVGDDDDGIKLKNSARELVNKLRDHLGGKGVDPSVEKLLFENDATEFIETLRSMVTTEGLKVFSRESDGSIGRKVLKLVKGFGDLQDHAGAVLIAKVDELLTQSPDRELIDNLTKDETEALFDLRHTVARDFNAISGSELSKRYNGIEHLEGEEKEKAEASLARIAQVQKAINALYNARNAKDYQAAQAELAKIHVRNFSEKYKISHGTARADEVLKQLKTVEKSSTPQTVVIPTSFLDSAPELRIDFIKDSYKNATETLSFLGEEPKLEDITDVKVREKAEELIEANKTQNDDYSVTIKGNNSETLEKLKNFVADSKLASGSTDRALESDDFELLKDGLKKAILDEQKNDYQTKIKTAKETKEGIEAKFDKAIYSGDKDASTILEALGEEDRTKLEENLKATCDELGAWTLLLSSDDDQRVAQLRTLATDAKNDLLAKDNDIKRREDDEFKVLYRPLGRNAETVAFSVRNAMMDFLVDNEDSEFTREARDLLTAQTKDALKNEQVAYLRAMKDSREDLIKQGFSIYQRQQATDLFGVLGVENVGAVNTFYETNLAELVDTINALAGKQAKDGVSKSKHFSGSFEFSPTESAILTRADDADKDAADKVKTRANKLTIIVNKMQEIARTTATNDELKAAIAGNEALSSIYDNVVSKKDKIDPILKRLDSIKQQIKDEEKALGKIKREYAAWTSSNKGGEGIFDFKTGKSFLSGSLKYLHGIITRMFSHASEAVKKEHSEQISKRVETAVKDLDSDNAFDEVAASALNQFSTIGTVVNYQKSKHLAREIQSTTDSSRAASA